MEDLKRAKIAALKDLVMKPRPLGRMDRDDRFFIDDLKAAVAWLISEIESPMGQSKKPKSTH